MSEHDRLIAETGGAATGGLAAPRKRILVVEDEAVIAMLIEDMLEDLGIDCIGPAGSVAEAERYIASETFDAALLDVQLHGVDSAPIAMRFVEAGRPFAFATGHAIAEKPGFSGIPVLQKPFDLAALADMVDGLLKLEGAILGPETKRGRPER